MSLSNITDDNQLDLSEADQLIAQVIANQSAAAANATAIGGKADSTHTHTIENVSGLQSALNEKVAGLNGATGMWIGTQAQYDLLTPSNTVAYLIIPA